MRLKFVLLGAGVVVSMGLLLVAGIVGTSGFAYYQTVSEFLGSDGRGADGFRINGKVAHGTIERLPTGQDVVFVMTDGSASMPVRYHGIVPDTFVDGADVVVEGGLEPDGTFAAHTLLAKCPSKYESADGADPAPSAPAAAEATEL